MLQESFLNDSIIFFLSGTFTSMSLPYGVIVTNQNCLYSSSLFKYGIKGCGFFVQNAKQSTTLGDKLYLVT